MKKTLGLHATLLLLALLISVSATAGTVSISPAATTVSAGQTFSVDVRIDDVANLYSFQFDIGYDPTLLNALQIVQGPFMQDADWLAGAIDNTSGYIPFAGSLIGPLPGITGSGVLATIDFLAVGTGTGSVSILEGVFLNWMPDDITLDTVPGSVNVTTPVPEPSTAILLSCGMLGMAILLHRKLRANRVVNRTHESAL